MMKRERKAWHSTEPKGHRPWVELDWKLSCSRSVYIVVYGVGDLNRLPLSRLFDYTYVGICAHDGYFWVNVWIYSIITFLTVFSSLLSGSLFNCAWAFPPVCYCSLVRLCLYSFVLFSHPPLFVRRHWSPFSSSLVSSFFLFFLLNFNHIFLTRLSKWSFVVYFFLAVIIC